MSQSKYLQSQLENLVASYETEINYTPVEIELDPRHITPEDITALVSFVSDIRKRLFIFKIAGDERTSNELALIARRSVLNNTAAIILQNTSNEPKIYPLKKALATNTASVRPRIQIQKSFALPKTPVVLQDIDPEHVEHIARPDINLIPVELPEFPELTKQLKALGIEYLQDSTLLLIAEHAYAFKDGIIPNNLPKGFYINKERQALCYTDTPRRLPSALAPVLKQQEPLKLPSIELIQALLPVDIPKSTLALLMNETYSIAQKNALIKQLPSYSDEIKALFQLLKPGDTRNNSQAPKRSDLEFIVPLLCKQSILGGEAHAVLFARLINSCLNKKISLEFLKYPEVQESFLSTRGVKNLQKLISLPAEQKEWWNKLATAHLSYDAEHFDFNTFFEAYTQVFLPRIAEKNLTLPNPCPIEHNGHLLITLNRVLDVIEHSENPQEQCLSLSQLNWGPTGVHYAMTQRPDPESLKQVAACMNISNPEDTNTDPELIHQEIENEQLDLKPWLYRYMGQHWKAEIRLSDINAQLLEIEKLADWTPVQKNQLIFILTCTFSEKATLNSQQWKKTLSSCIISLQTLEQTERSDLLQALSQCFKFKPNVSLAQVNTLMKQCIELKSAFPTKNFKEELISPLVSCLENEGFELFNTLQERIQKTDSGAEGSQFSLTALASFTTTLQNNRHKLSPNLIKLLAKLNEPELTQTSIDLTLKALESLQAKKGEAFITLLLTTLSQINISKSTSLPKIEQINALIEALTNSTEVIPVDCKTPDKQEAWLKDSIIEKNLLPGCVLGNGDISKLDDLIVDALIDAIKKRSAVFDVEPLKKALQTNLQAYIVPQQLRDQLNIELMPLFDAVKELVDLLQTPNPKFPEVIEKLRYFEEKKPVLLNGMYSLSLLGQTKGEFILSFLLTGKRKANDTITGSGFAAILGQLHGLFLSEMKGFFDNPKNKLIVKDLDINTSLSWMAAFNNTHALTFFFKEELIQKKVLPALKKTLQQLNTQDPEFEKSILDEAAILAENEPSDQSLQGYKNKIESIANYLNLLIEINDRLPAQFNTIYKQLSKGPLARLNYSQKQILINNLIKNKSAELDFYLKLTTQALEENPHADSTAIERAINGLVALFNLSDLEPETQVMFFKMSMTHNLKSSSPFPLAALSDLKKSNLPEKTKSSIIKQIIQILVGLSGADSSDHIQGLVNQTQLFLTTNQEQAGLCISLLKRVLQENPHQDLIAYPYILQQLAQIKPENRGKIAIILTGLANSKKNYTANLTALLEITKGLGRRSAEDVDQVLKLFATPPFPNTQDLNAALLSPDSEKLQAYCLSFDTNPFAKTGEKRNLAAQFTTDRIKEALLSLQDLLHETDLPHSLQMKLAKQLTFIETLGYTDPLNPKDFSSLKKLTKSSRHDLKEQAGILLEQMRAKEIAPDQVEIAQLHLLACLREIYFRTTGLFPNTTQMLVLLIAMNDPSSNLLMRIKTGEGKSINTPMLSVLQWAQGGTVDQCTANPTLLIRDYENNCEPFFTFLGIKSALIQSNSAPEAYQRDGINCSTVEDMSIFRLAAKEAKKEALLENGGPVHVVLDESDDALLDQVTLYKLVAELEQSENAESNPAQWIYPMAHKFINLSTFRNIEPDKGKVLDEEEDLEQFRLFLNKEINDQFNGNVEKQNYLMASSNTQLKQWIHASCMAATLVENKHYIVQPLKEKDESGHEVTKKIISVPLIRSTPKTGSIFTEAVQQALQARLRAESKDQAHYYVIDAVPSVLASQSSRGLIKFYQNTKGRLLGVSATPGDKRELESLATSLGTQAISVAPYAGDKRVNHPPIFTSNPAETIEAVHHTLDRIKLPITKPTMEINADAAIQTYEERESLIEQRKSAIDKWSHTQTQPILIINEDFNEAKNLGASLDAYRKQGFKIQIITGKESPIELDRIIKQAGQVNTITVGTAMLAKGIDINTGDHPRGLFVIQTYPDTERMTTQIAGRAARNGKPGEWLPIYQIKPPQNLIDLISYYIFPWRRQKINERTVELLKNKIKLQATVDRLYTQAIDEAQQTLMQQIEAWESLLLELYPSDPKIQFEFYQWRELLLGELTRSQETTLSEDTLAASISQFKKVACKLWETAREETWAAKAQKAAHITSEQSLKLKYLRQIDLAQELTIQTELQQKSKEFTAGAQGLMHQNLDTMIMDKAGVVLDYTKPTGQTKKDLELAQNKQLLPKLIGDFCALNPEAIRLLFPENPPQNPSYLPEAVSDFFNKVIEQKNKVLHNEELEGVTQTIIRYYQNKLMDADEKTIQTLLNKIKPLLLKHCKEIANSSLVDQFKMQGFILTFCTLYQNSGLPEDKQLNKLKARYNDEIMETLAQHLLEQLAWVKETPEPFHAYFERDVAKKAALAIYDLAEDLINSPQDPIKIQALYKALKEQKLILKDKYLFSIGHSSPRNVVNTALEAIDSLHSAPDCDIEFRNNCHDQVLSNHHLSQFRNTLKNKSPYFFTTNDVTWDHLKKTLLKLSHQSKENPSHVIQELSEAIARFKTYEAYQPYLQQLTALNNQLSGSIQAYNKADGLKQDAQERLFAKKTTQFAALLEVNPEKVRIQSGSDGIQSYIEIQVEDAPLKEGFTGYQSSFLGRIETERAELQRIKSDFEINREALVTLTAIAAIEAVTDSKRTEFEKLFKLKALLGEDWHTLDSVTRGELPDLIQDRLKQIDEIRKWNWTLEPVDLNKLQGFLGKAPDRSFTDLLDTQLELKESLEEIKDRIADAQGQLRDHKQKITDTEELLRLAQARRQHPECGNMESIRLAGQILYYQSSVHSLQRQLANHERVLEDVQNEERETNNELITHNQLLDNKRAEFTPILINKAKDELSVYLQKTSQHLVDEIEEELREMEPAIDRIQQAESKKSHYQTRRFFKPSELLSFEARLAHEEETIPKQTELSTEEVDSHELDSGLLIIS